MKNRIVSFVIVGSVFMSGVGDFAFALRKELKEHKDQKSDFSAKIIQRNYRDHLVRKAYQAEKAKKASQSNTPLDAGSAAAAAAADSSAPSPLSASSSSSRSDQSGSAALESNVGLQDLPKDVQYLIFNQLDPKGLSALDGVSRSCRNVVRDLDLIRLKKIDPELAKKRYEEKRSRAVKEKYCKFMNIPVTSSHREVVKSYRGFMRIIHPDKGLITSPKPAQELNNLYDQYKELYGSDGTKEIQF